MLSYRDKVLYLANEEEIDALTLFTLNGQCICSMENPPAMLDVARFELDVHFAVINLSGGNCIVKKIAV